MTHEITCLVIAGGGRVTTEHDRAARATRVARLNARQYQPPPSTANHSRPKREEQFELYKGVRVPCSYELVTTTRPGHRSSDMAATSTDALKTSLPRNTASGLKNSTHSSLTSSSAEKYSLNDEDDALILLYKYRGGLQTSSQRDLCASLDKGESCLPAHAFVHVSTSRINVKY